MRACPNCDEVVNGATGVDHENQPKPEDISICFNCAAVNQFDSDMKLKPIKEGLLETIKEIRPADYDLIMEVVSRIKRVKKDV